MRSKNHMLYELYLTEAGAIDLFEKTERYSLSHIVTFVDIYDQLRDGQTAKEIIQIATGERIRRIEDMNDLHFSIYSSIKGLYSKLNALEVDVIAEVIDKIDQYHENKRSETI